MARRTITIEEKIARQEAVVAAAKHKYDAAVDELEKLIARRRETGRQESACSIPRR